MFRVSERKGRLLIFWVCFLLIFPVFFAFAQTEQTEDGVESTGSVSLENPIEAETPQEFIGNILNAVLGVVGSLALLMFVYGGLVWMTAAGNADKVQKGKSILTWAALGLVIIFTSYALVNFVIAELVGAG